eukprot:symbB.v1.2.024146.t1/scaffold2264.1/size174359/1
MWICIAVSFAVWHNFLSMLYRRDRALEVAPEVVDGPDGGSNEPPPLEDGNVDEVSEAGDVVPVAKPSRNKGGAKRKDWQHFATEKIGLPRRSSPGSYWACGPEDDNVGASDEDGSCLLHHFLFRRLSISQMPFFSCGLVTWIALEFLLQMVFLTARGELLSSPFGRKFYIHRCFQHVKANVKEESSRRDHVSGKARLQNRELVGPLVEWLEFSAALPCDVEFDAFWQNIFRRMEGQALATDFGEPRMAAYLQKHIFDTAGPLVKAPWCSGLGAVPEGYSCYGANTIESGHKSLKQLLSGAPRHRNVGQLLLQVSEAVTSKAESGFYNDLRQSVTEPPSALEQWPRKRRQRIQAEDVEDDTGKTVKRLDKMTIFDHYKVACHHVEKKTYDIYWHIKLRQSFVAVFVTSVGRVIDQHRDWVTSGGYSERSLFIDTLVNDKAAMKAIPRGPKHSQPKRKVKKVQQKRSEATKRMLSAPDPVQEDREVMVVQKHDAAARYDRDQLDMAVQLSLAENAEAAKRRAESRTKLAPRLKELTGRVNSSVFASRQASPWTLLISDPKL